MALVGAQFVNAVSPNPVGSLQAFAGASAPTGWLLCDGTSYSTSVYPELFSVLGYTYGGSGANFNVPDLRGRVPMGAGTGAQNGGSGSGVISGGTALTARTRGAFGGDERLQTHTHTFSGTTGGMGHNLMRDAGGGGNVAWVGGNNMSGIGDHTHAFSGTTATHNQSAGSGQNMPPFLVTNYIIKAVPDAPRSGLAYGSTPPIVTALPANPQFGDVVTYIADATNGVAWSLQYDASGTYPWKFIGGSTLYHTVETDQAIAPGVGRTWGDLATVGPTVTLPLAGDYDVMWGARMWNTANAGSPLMAVSFGGAAPVYTQEAMWPYNNGTGAAVAPGGAWQGARSIRRTVSTAGQTAQAKYSSDTGGTTSNFQSRWLRAAPVRVKAA